MGARRDILPDERREIFNQVVAVEKMYRLIVTRRREETNAGLTKYGQSNGR